MVENPANFAALNATFLLYSYPGGLVILTGFEGRGTLLEPFFLFPTEDLVVFLDERVGAMIADKARGLYVGILRVIV